MRRTLSRSVRPLSDSLKASITLDKTSYAVGDTANGTVTLTNVGDLPISDVYAGCDPADSGQEIKVPPAQWGDFNPAKPAGKLAPGERVVIKVSGKVPDKASYFGRTGIGCYFDNFKTYGSGPYTFAGAKVPGKRADSRGQVWTDKNGNGRPDAGEGLAKLKVVLTTDGTNVAAFAQTDANGFATFTNVPVGIYRLRPVGPSWQTADDADVYVIAPPYGFGEWHMRMTPR